MFFLGFFVSQVVIQSLALALNNALMEILENSEFQT